LKLAAFLLLLSCLAQIAELLRKRGLPEAVFLVRLVLWLLSTRLGTFLLCGSLCFGEKWLCIKNFSSISLDKREKVLQKWFKRRFFTAIRIAFIYVKVLCVFVFFSRVMFPSLCKILCSLFFGI